jgi:ribonuclease HII
MICGLDEVGRGPLAGPVVASAVLLGEDELIPGLADSKKISEKRRETLAPIIKAQSLAWGIGWVWPGEIDTINIHRASLLAMIRAFEDMFLRSSAAVQEMPFAIQVDGKFLPDFPGSPQFDPHLHGPLEAIIKGDSLIPAISAASILAKVARDKWMTEYSVREPVYGFERHKGYPTAAHREAIRVHGPSKIQRMSFRY